MTTLAGTGLAIVGSKPLWQGNTFLDYRDEDLVERASSYQHRIVSLGGYDNASLVLSERTKVANDWLLNGLGRHIETLEPSGDIIWEGFVNQITVTRGGATYTVGPLLDIANEVKAIYRKVNTATTIPLIPVNTESAWITATASAARFGTHRRIINKGEMSETEMDQAVQLYLNEHRRMPMKQMISLKSQKAPSTKIDILGYWHMLGYPYDNPTGTGDSTITNKLGDILDADPNSLFSAANSSRDNNATAVQDYEGSAREAKSLITTLVATSDSGFDRYKAGIYAGRKFFYEEVPALSYTEPPSYNYDDEEPYNPLMDSDMSPLEPWDLKPGFWLHNMGFDIGVNFETQLSDDTYQNIFLESVTYSMPGDVQVNGGKILGLDARISRKYGIRGQWV